MKNAFFFTVTIILLFGFQGSISAQKTATWKGGTPGRATDWNCESNWKEGRVPDEFSNVVIPDVSSSTFSYPIIEEEVEILSLLCASSAHLTVLDKAILRVILPFAAITDICINDASRIESQTGLAVLPRK